MTEHVVDVDGANASNEAPIQVLQVFRHPQQLKQDSSASIIDVVNSEGIPPGQLPPAAGVPLKAGE